MNSAGILNGIDYGEVFDSLPVGILIFNSEFQIVRVNRNFNSFVTQSSSASLTSPGKDLLALDFVRKYKLSDELTGLEDSVSFERELTRIKTPGSSEISIFLKATSIYRKGEFAGGIILIEDILGDFITRKEASFAGPLFQDFVSGIAEHYILTDDSGNVISTSLRFRKDFLGFTCQKGFNIIDSFSESNYLALKKLYSGFHSGEKSAKIILELEEKRDL